MTLRPGFRTVLVAFDVDSHAHPNADNPEVDLTVARMAVATDEDIADGVRARLDEFYPTDDGYPFVPAGVRVAVADPDAVGCVLAAAEVGLDGADMMFDADTVTAAEDVLAALRRSDDDSTARRCRIQISTQKVYTVVDDEGLALFVTTDPAKARRTAAGFGA